ncbi:DUF4260 family protein [Amycolatopsis acidicola]|uniref:DUF4260 family protein n=1 Tax=Amycolatopsis acidicola TaxID=2596893 RepID=A0A5N0UYA8_9PSEU|nr:DUF4260 family protein [Amycolatopsis acidicola]KAA9158573.1 DUF4260 family protein [Amycolatopsis acidicola]
MKRIANALLAALLVPLAVYEAFSYGGWVAVAVVAGLIGPDLTFLIGIGQQAEHGVLPRRVVPFYNALHFWPVPLFVMVSPLFLYDSKAVYALGLAWLAHICADRAFGYGLRAADGTQRAVAHS